MQNGLLGWVSTAKDKPLTLIFLFHFLRDFGIV